MDPWFPVYDPFIFGDNCNYEIQETCYEDIIPDIEVLRRYLAVRDAFPKKALKHTRVIALSGVNAEAVKLINESLSKQEKNPAPVDMYFYSDSKLDHRIDSSLAALLITLSAFTYPKRIVFGIGDIKREGMADILQWMVNKREEGYFRNLEYFEISGHKIASYDGTVDEGDALNEIVNNLREICNDDTNFPLLTTLNFDFNGYSSSDSFVTALVNACGNKRVSTEEYGGYYAPMCSDSSWNLGYYDMYSEQEKAQCRFTWNWEVSEPSIVYSPDGPFPNVNTDHCPGATTQPTTQTPTTIFPTTETPTIAPTTETPTTIVPTTETPITCTPVEIAVVPSELAPNPATIEIVNITSGLCSSYGGTEFILRGLPALKSIVIGNECFGSVRVFELDGLCELERVVIGEKSFVFDWSERSDGSYRIMNCPSLKSIQIRNWSFNDYNVFELTNLLSLQSVSIGRASFFFGSSFSLTSMID